MTRADTLLKIKDAEAKAAQTVKDAQEKQKAIVANARRDAIKMVQDAEAKMREDNDKAYAAERAKVSANKSELLSKGNDEAKQARARAATKMAAIQTHMKETFDKAI